MTNMLSRICYCLKNDPVNTGPGNNNDHKMQWQKAIKG